MSNRIYLDQYISEHKSGVKTLRFVFMDDNANISDSLIVEEVKFLEPLDLLKAVVKQINDYSMSDGIELIEYINRYEKGINIDDSYYEYDDIKDSLLYDEDDEYAEVQD